MLFLIIFQAKKMKIRPLFGFLWIFRQKKGKIQKLSVFFTFKTAIESYEHIDYACFIHFKKISKKKNFL